MSRTHVETHAHIHRHTNITHSNTPPPTCTKNTHVASRELESNIARRIVGPAPVVVVLWWWNTVCKQRCYSGVAPPTGSFHLHGKHSASTPRYTPALLFVLKSNLKLRTTSLVAIVWIHVWSSTCTSESTHMQTFVLQFKRYWQRTLHQHHHRYEWGTLLNEHTAHWKTVNLSMPCAKLVAHIITAT